MPYQTQKGAYSVSTDKRKLNTPVIHNYLKDAYWCKNIPIEVVKRSIKGSFCFGIYHQKKQVGFARVITDSATFGYLADVFILPEYQDNGLGKFLITSIMECPDFKGLRSWSLATKDAHGLYAQFGFKPLIEPEKRMVKVNFTDY